MKIEYHTIASLPGNQLFDNQQETMPSGVKEFQWHTFYMILQLFRCQQRIPWDVFTFKF
jgi:hypothetical protein